MVSESDMHFEEIESDFEAIIKHPKIDAVIELAREQQARIDSGDLSDTDGIDAVIESLDSIWEFHDQVGRVSGHAILWHPDEQAGTFELKNSYLNDAPLQSKGFVMQTTIMDTESDPEICLLFRTNTYISSDLPLSEVSRDMLCAVSLKNVDMSGFRTEQSMEITAMNTYLPEAARDLYEAIYDDQSKNHNDWHNTLRSLVVEVPKDNVADGVDAMVSFANRHYDVDSRQLPIVINITEGMPVMTVDEENELTVGLSVHNGPRYFYPVSLDLRLYCEPSDEKIVIHENKLSWVVHGSTTTQDGEWVQVAVPIQSVASMRELPPLE